MKKVALLVFLMLIPANLFGQVAGPRSVDENARFSASASSSYQFKSGMDGGGDISIARYGVGVGGSAPLSDRTGVSARLNFLREDYDFSGANGFPVQKPWSRFS